MVELHRVKYKICWVVLQSYLQIITKILSRSYG